MNMRNIMTGTYFYNDESYNFNFYTTLSASEKITFVNSVVNTVVDDNYNSLVRDLMFDYMVVRVMTDIDTSFINNSESQIDLIEEFLEETNIVNIVKANMEIGLLESLSTAVDRAIEFRTGIHPNPLNDAIASLLSTLERKVEEIDLGSAMEMAQKFAGMTGDFTLDNIMNAYMNSDLHKQNMDKIEEAKKQRAEFAKDMDKAIKAVKGSKKAKKESKEEK